MSEERDIAELIKDGWLFGHYGEGIRHRAADEIRRLRAEVERLQNKLNVDSQNFEIACLRAEIERLKDDLKWYGHTIAGGGPMIGYASVGRRAEKHWYQITEPMIRGK